MRLPQFENWTRATTRVRLAASATGRESVVSFYSQFIARNTAPLWLIRVLTVALVAGLIGLNFSATLPVHASTPDLGRQIPVTARMINPATRLPVADGTYTVRYAIYSINRTTSDAFPSDSDAGSRLWTETKNVTTRNGILFSFLGSSTPLPTSIDFASNSLFLGIRINDDPELAPRRKLGQVPGAITADNLQGKEPGTGVNNVLTTDASGQLQVSSSPVASTTSSVVLLGSNFTGGSSGGTFYGANAALGFSGNLLDLKVNGTSKFTVDSTGKLVAGTIDSSLLGSSVVTSFAKTGGTQRTGNISLTQGSNITITDNGDNTFSIASAGGGGSGTVTQVNSGAGLSGGPITTTGTLSVDSSIIPFLANTQSFTGKNTFSRNGSGVSDYTLGVTGTPINDGASSLVRIGNAISGGNAVANGGTYLGINAPGSGAGSVADLMNLQTNNTVEFKVTSGGAVTANGTINGQTISSSASFTGTVTVATGLSVTAGGINVNSSGITNAGAISGATTISTSGAINGATISGGTLSGGTVSGGSLSATAVNGLSVSGGTITVGTWNGTQIGAIYGGTGQTAVATGDLLYGSASNVWSRLGISATANQCLITNGTIPVWGSCSGSGSGVTLQSAYNGGATITTVDGTPIAITSGNTTGTGASAGLSVVANALTTGYGLSVASSSLTSGTLVDIQATGTAGADGQRAFQAQTSGSNPSSGATTYGGYITDTRTGTSSTNVGLYVAATSGTTNYGLIVASGKVGIGTVGPTAAGLQVATASAVSAPAVMLDGTWFSGGSATTTKPHFLIQPAGTTSTGWSTSGTGLGINAASGFSGNLIDVQVAGTSKAKIDSAGALTVTSCSGCGGASSLQGAYNGGATITTVDGTPIAVTAANTTGNGLSVASSTLTGGNAVSFSSTSTVAASNTQTVLNVATSGTNGTSAQTTYALQAANTHAGTTSTNVAGYFTASGGTTANYAIQVASGQVLSQSAGAASTPAEILTGAWYVSGTATTTKPQLLIEPTGATSTGWSAVGTGLGVNAASGFTGNLVDFQLNGVSKFLVSSAGNLTVAGSGTHAFSGTIQVSTITSSGALAITSAANGNISLTPNGTGKINLVTSGNASSAVTIGDGGTTDYAKFDNTGTLTFNGLARPYSEMILIPNDATIPASNSCARNQTEATNHTYQTLDCADGAVTVWDDWQFRMPQNYVNGTNVEVNVYWVANATSNAAKFDIGYTAVANAAQWDTAARSDVAGSAVTTGGTAYLINTSTVTLTTPSINSSDMVNFRVARDANAASDTLTVAAKIISVRLKYLITN